jgi:hypothetical protein
MIVNAYAILDAFLCLVRLTLGLLVASGGFLAWRSWRGAAARSVGNERGAQLEERYYLLFLMAIVLVALNLVSWPLLYLLLQSYVPQWPGVMCIHGVTQVGAGSTGDSRFLPGIVVWLESLKPALAFVTGGWVCLHLLNRRTRTAPLTGAVLLGMAAAGALATVDAGLETAYLWIPKKEEFLSVGCCSVTAGVASNDSALALPSVIAGRPRRDWIGLAALVAQGAIVLGLVAALSRPSRQSRGAVLGLSVAALAALVAGFAFLKEIGAPRLLVLPYHHCLYCLFAKIPEALVAAVLLVGSSFAVGWAGVTERWRNWPEVTPAALALRNGLLRAALWGYLASMAILAIALWLAG